MCCDCASQLSEFTWAAAPKKPRLSHPLPRLVVGCSREQRDEWLNTLAGDVPLAHLARNAPHGLRGAALLDEFASRSVAVPRALWFLKLVTLQSDAPIVPGVGGGATSRVASTLSARNKATLEDMRRAIEAAVAELASCGWRIAAPQTKSSIGEQHSTADMGLAALMTQCGLELPASSVASMQSSSATAAFQSSTSPSLDGALSPSDRWSHSLHRWHYLHDLLAYAWHEGVVARLSTLASIVESFVQSSASWSAPPHVLRFFCAYLPLRRWLPTLATSRAHAQRIITACVSLHERCSATLRPAASSSASSSSVSFGFGSSLLLQLAAPLLLSLCNTLLRTLCTALPMSQSLLSAPPSSAADSVPSTTVDSAAAWRWSWLTGGESDGESLPSTVASSSSISESSTLSQATTPLQLDAEAMRDELDVFPMELEANPKQRSVASLPHVANSPSSLDTSAHSSVSTSLVSSVPPFTAPSPAASLLALSGALTPDSFADSAWHFCSARFFSLLHDLCAGDLSPPPTLSLLPRVSYPTLLASSLRSSLSPLQCDWPAALQPDPDLIHSFDAATFLAQTASSADANSSIRAMAHFLRQAPHLSDVGLPLLLVWSIKSPLINAVDLVCTLLACYFPPAAASSTVDSDGSSLSASIHAFLRDFRPKCRVELARATQLFSRLTTLGLLSLEQLTQQLLLSGSVVPASEEGLTDRAAEQCLERAMEGDWHALARYYTMHLPPPLPSPNASSSHQFPASSSSTSSLLPSTRLLPSLEPVDTRQRAVWRALGLSVERDMRACDLVFLDLLWLWQSEAAAIGSDADSSLFRAQFQHLHDSVRRGVSRSITPARSTAQAMMRNTHSCFRASSLVCWLLAESLERCRSPVASSHLARACWPRLSCFILRTLSCRGSGQSPSILLASLSSSTFSTHHPLAAISGL